MLFILRLKTHKSHTKICDRKHNSNSIIRCF